MKCLKERAELCEMHVNARREKFEAYLKAARSMTPEQLKEARRILRKGTDTRFLNKSLFDYGQSLKRALGLL